MNAIEMDNIVKKFPGVIANNEISLEIKDGEIHALLGENGAGKTTLMNILYGLYTPDEGEIRIYGEKKDINTPSDAIELNIGMVHQHFMLVSTLTVAENFVLGAEPNENFVFDFNRSVKELEKITSKYGFDLDPYAKVENISVGMQQRLEILKALYRGAKILILDEPTAVLTPQQIEEFYNVLENLKEMGHTIILITHKLKEVKRISDRVTVIRDGEKIGTVKTKETTEKELAKMMVGREIIFKVKKTAREAGEKILSIEDLKAKDYRGLQALKGISLEVHAGEIVGICGIEGNGQRELVDILSGLMAWQGDITVNGEKITPPVDARELLYKGVVHIPEDRQKYGLIMDFSVKENLILGKTGLKQFSKKFLIDFKEVEKYSNDLVKNYDIKVPDIDVKATKLSGGNQQKVILARELACKPKLLVAAQPTRGLDVGAIEFVHNRLVEQRDNNNGILLVSYELDEILNLSDRIYVIHEGELVNEFVADNVTAEELGFWMGGGKEEA